MDVLRRDENKTPGVREALTWMTGRGAIYLTS
jgi:hypothetical protein